jgi:hypothetical protein
MIGGRWTGVQGPAASREWAAIDTREALRALVKLAKAGIGRNMNNLHMCPTIDRMADLRDKLYIDLQRSPHHLVRNYTVKANYYLNTQKECDQQKKKAGNTYSLIARSTMIEISLQIRTRTTTTSRKQPRTRRRTTRTTML